MTTVGAFILAAGCGGGGGGHGGGGGGGLTTGNAAVDATLPTLETGLRSGAVDLPSTITLGVIPSPITAPIGSPSTAVGLGAAANDGTAGSVDVAVIVSYNTTTGAFVETTSVDEASTGFQFLFATYSASALQFSVRVPAEGTAGLTSGVGTFYCIFNVSQQVSFSRTFANSSATTMATLVNFGSIPNLPTSSLTGSGTFSQDYLLQYSLAGSPVVATLVAMTATSGSQIVSRTGGPLMSQLGYNFSNVSFAGVGYNTLTDVVVPIANDIPTGISPTSAFVVNGTETGGFSSVATVFSDTVVVAGPFVGSPATQTVPTIAESTALTGLAFVNSGHITATQNILVVGAEQENVLPNNTFQTSLDGRLGQVSTAKSALYLPEGTSRTTTFYIFQ
jgi:hypothetical protein